MMKLRFSILLALAVLLVNCTATPTPTAQPPATAVQASTIAPTLTPSPSDTPNPSSTPNVMGMVFVAQYDPTKNVVTIYGTTPGATIVYNGTPLVPPPTANATETPLPTTPAPTPVPPTLPRPIVVAPKPTQVPTAVSINEASLKGRVMFKSTRDGGLYPNAFSYYVMNPDGSNIQKLDSQAAAAIYARLQGREGYSPDGERVVLGERSCYGISTCNLYILDTTLDADLIYSNNDISRGQWISHSNYKAKDPVWSPAFDYIAFASNHEADPGCAKTMNIFKARPGQNPVTRRLTTGSDFCGGGNGGHPSFNGAGSQLVFWSEGSGLKQIYLLDVGADDSYDYRESNAHIISDHKSEDWDPLWVK